MKNIKKYVGKVFIIVGVCIILILPYAIYNHQGTVDACKDRNELALKELKANEKASQKLEYLMKEAVQDRLNLWQDLAYLLYNFIVISGVLVILLGRLILEIEKIKKVQQNESPD